MQHRRLDEDGERLLIERELFAEQQAEHRDVYRVAIGQVLVLLDGENLRERRIARGHAAHQQLDEIANGPDVEETIRRQLLERLLRQRERFLVIGIEHLGRSFRPLVRAPAGVERHEARNRDVLDAAAGQLRRDRTVERELAPPQKRGQRRDLVDGDAASNVKAVDRQPVVAVAASLARNAVQVHHAADDVDAERIIVFQVVADGLVRFTQLLGNERMAGRVNRGQRPERGERLEDAVRIGGGLVCAHCSRFRALLPTRATAGLQK